jgi:transcriptional regulator with XRE-family HTH domain
MINPEKIKNAKSCAFPSELTSEEKFQARFYAKLAMFVYNEREAQGLTQAQFAEKFHISQSTVSKIETADGGISLAAVIDVASKLGFELDFTNTAKDKGKIVSLADRRGKARKLTSMSSRDNKFYGQSFSVTDQYLEEM